MNILKTYGLGGVALVIAILALFVHGQSQTIVKTVTLGGTTNYDTVSAGQGIITTGINSTSTNATTNQVLSQADIQGYSLVSIAPNLVGNISLIVPATTSISGWLPNPGDRTNFVLLNATGTAGAIIGLAPNTGSLVQIATTSSGVYIGSSTPNKAMKVEVIRKANTDLIWLISPFI